MASKKPITKSTIEEVKKEWDKLAPAFVHTAIDLWLQSSMTESQKETFVAQLNTMPQEGKWFVTKMADDNSGFVREEFVITVDHWEKIGELAKSWRQVYLGNYTNPDSVKGRYATTARAVHKLYKNPKWV